MYNVLILTFFKKNTYAGLDTSKRMTQVDITENFAEQYKDLCIKT